MPPSSAFLPRKKADDVTVVCELKYSFPFNYRNIKKIIYVTLVFVESCKFSICSWGLTTNFFLSIFTSYYPFFSATLPPASRPLFGTIVQKVEATANQQGKVPGNVCLRSGREEHPCQELASAQGSVLPKAGRIKTRCHPESTGELQHFQGRLTANNWMAHSELCAL